MSIHLWTDFLYNMIYWKIILEAWQDKYQVRIIRVGRDLAEPVKCACFKVRKVRFRQKKSDLPKD